jgi:hypothetical protein
MAYFIPKLVNGKAYEWADIQINILGSVFTGVTAIKYSEPQEMKNVMAAGRFPNARIYGQTSPEASITLLMSEVEAIQRVAPLGRIQDIPEFDIVVMYLDSANVTVKHAVRKCRFTSNSRESETGSDAISVEIPLVIAGVDFI